MGKSKRRSMDVGKGFRLHKGRGGVTSMGKKLGETTVNVNKRGRLRGTKRGKVTEAFSGCLLPVVGAALLPALLLVALSPLIVAGMGR